jgi:hypothetical protein
MNKINVGILFCSLLLCTSITWAQTDDSLTNKPSESVIQSVLQKGQLFVSAVPPDSQHGLHAVPSSVIEVYYLQLPLPLGKQLTAQGIELASRSDLAENFQDKMVDLGWPDNDPTYNPFGFNQKVGMKLKVTGDLYSDFRAPQTHLSGVFMKAVKVEVLKSFETEKW